MTSRLLCFFTLVAASSWADEFDAANQQLKEQSYSKACDSFTGFLKANPTHALVREATAKRALACMNVGRGSADELRKIANEGEKDFARAWASHALYLRGEKSFDSITSLLKQAAGDSTRTAAEARTILVADGLNELQRESYNPARTGPLADLVLEYATSATDQAHARLIRGQSNLRDSTRIAKGEKELREVGSGTTDFADDALYTIAEYRSNRAEFVAALELYDEIVKRFSPTTSNMRSNAQSQAAEIRRPWVTVSTTGVSLPGVKPQIALNWRNVTNASYTLSRVDPMSLRGYTSDSSGFAQTITATVAKWQATLSVEEPYKQGSQQFDLDKAAEPGAYLLRVDADGQHAETIVLVTQLALITKTDHENLYVYVADVETGEARRDADITAYVYSRAEKLTLKSGPDGLAKLTLPSNVASSSIQVWARSGAHYANAYAGSSGWSNSSHQELPYVMPDRPLYKPGETVGLKFFFREREGGPSSPLSGRSVTLTVRDAQGKPVHEVSLTTNDFGTASTTFQLAKNAGLGAYSTSVRDQRTSRTYTTAHFRVEEYKPPESTVTVEPLGQPKPGEPVKVKVRATYLSGGALANAAGRAIVTVSPWTHVWGRWPDDAGEEPSMSDNDDERPRRYYRGYHPTLSQETLVFKTGADGTVELTLGANDALRQSAYESLEYQVRVFVTDASRREISGSGTMHLSNVPFFVDVRTSHDIYRPGERVAAALRAEDANGRPVSADVMVTLYRLSESPTGGSTRIGEVKTRIVNGVGAVLLDADALGQARIEVTDATGARPGALAESLLWLTSDTKPIIPPRSGFMLYVDRAPLKVGDSLRALVAAPDRQGGHVLVTIENEAVQEAKVVPLRGRAAFVEFKLTAAMAPNSVLMAARFEDTVPYQQQHPIKVSGSEAEFPVRVSFGQSSAEPGAKVAARIEIEPKVPAEATLTVVDQALFALEPEHTDFLSYFGRTPRSLQVRTYRSHDSGGYRARPRQQASQPPSDAAPDSRERKVAKTVLADEDDRARRGAAAPVLAEVASAEPPSPSPSKPAAKEKRAYKDAEAEEGASSNAIGSSAVGSEVRVRSDFSSSSGFWPQLAFDTGAVSQPVTFKDSLTSWKAVATVVTKSARLGQGSTTLRTAKPLMVRLQAPRFFIEGDEVVLSAVIESHLPSAQQLDVVISAPGFKALSEASKRLRVEPETTTRFDARFKVVELGERTLRAQVKGGGTGDAMEWKLPAFVHGSAQRQFFAGRMTDGFSFEVELPEKRKTAMTRLELSLSPSLLAVMFDGLPYLAEYPYGCVEQTLSRFVPATVARKAVSDLNLPPQRVPANLDDMIARGLERLSGFQHADGGWGWWHDDTTNDWMTAYVVYALGLAQSANVKFDASMIKRGREYLISHLGRQLDTPETHAFMVFALASTGGAPKASVDTLYGRRTKLSASARAQLALALLATKDPRARVAVDNLDDVVKAATTRNDAAVGNVTDAWSTSAAIEATAFTLMAYARYDLKSPLIAPLTDFLVLRRNGGRWRNTRDTAFSIYALADLARLERAHDARSAFVISVNGREVKRISSANGGLDLTAPLTFNDAALKPGKNVVQVKRDGAGTGYWAATFDTFNMNDFIKGVGGDVQVKRTYTLLGKPSTTPSKLGAEYGMPVESGVRTRVDLEITANKAVEFVMLEDLKPAGFEAVEVQSGPKVCNFACAHAELRTDRVALFLTQLPIGTTRLSYELRAEVPGRFSALPARVEAMYAPEIQATADEMRFEVRDEPPPVAGNQ